LDTYDAYLRESLLRLQTVMDDSVSRPILFVGTGISRRYINAPDWRQLLELLIEANPIIKYPLGYYAQKTNNHLPKVASLLVEDYYNYAWQNYNKGIYPKELYDSSHNKDIFLKYQISIICNDLLNNFNINDSIYKEELELLRKLKPHAIITTNYDCLLEEIFSDYTPVIGQQVIRKRESVNIGHILKIHGCVSKPDEIVISNEDYITFEQRQKYITAKLLTYFIEHPVVFIGYSLSDSNIKGIMRDICEVVAPNSDDIMENIWFIEYKQDKINPDFRPASDKVIDLGETKTIRVNYIQLNSFSELFQTLYQGTLASVNILNNLQNSIYNIVKSKTISNIEVDLLTLHRLSDENELIRLLELDKADKDLEKHKDSTIPMINFGYITDPQFVLTRYPLRISDISAELGFTYWYYANRLIEQIAEETGVNIKETNNRYHIDVGVNTPQHRYSADAKTLLEKVMKNESYFVYDEFDKKVYPRTSNT